MAYERVNWENLPSTNTPVNADNLNKMDEGIANIENELKLLNKNTIQEQQKQIEQLQKEIKELKGGNSSWVSLGNTVYYKKVGNVITVRGFSGGAVNLTANDYTIVAILPAEIRPSMEICFPWSKVGEGTVGITKIQLNGNIGLFANASTNFWAFNVTYLL